MDVPSGPRVLLRPFRMSELDVVLAAYAEEGNVSAPSPGRLRKRISNGGRFVDGRIDLAIETDGRLVGSIEARHPEAAAPPGVYEIGVGLYRAADRGHGYGRAAMSLLTNRLFDELDALRVQASTDVDNGAMRAVLERLGYTYEGTMRGFMPSPEGPRDYALYAITRADWERARA